MQVVYVDNHLLIVNKPAGLATQPHPGSTDSLLEQAKAWIKKEFKKPGNVFLEPIHRLDKPVSGLVLFARTSKALSRLQEMMRERQIEKTYFAWVEGIFPQDKGALEHYLVHDEHKARVVKASHPEGKIARLHYSVLKQEKNRSLVKIELETGRYHQIRVQCAAVGCPVVGDEKYGSEASYKKEGIALHSGCLVLQHPVTKEPLRLENIPSAFS
ncbi:MAG: RNA pseudouridine synthase [Candidatus Melainabacteria bacterium]|nr:RNA pseudouridine synthase [Candidatus Melainabacteria bacterium]